MINEKMLGRFPIDGSEARKTGEFFKINDESALKLVSGKKNPILLKFIVSNDVMNFGVAEIPTGGIGPRQTEWDSHKGDAVFYVKEGPATFFIANDNEAFLVQDGEFMFIPENTKYKIINYSDHMLKVVFIVAPEM